jgi:hypothetical protein
MVLSGLAIAAVAGVAWCIARSVDNGVGIAAFIYMLGAASVPVGAVEGGLGRPIDKTLVSAIVPSSLSATGAFVYLLVESKDSRQRVLVFGAFLAPFVLATVGLTVGWLLGRLLRRVGA